MKLRLSKLLRVRRTSRATSVPSSFNVGGGDDLPAPVDRAVSVEATTLLEGVGGEAESVPQLGWGASSDEGEESVPQPKFGTSSATKPVEDDYGDQPADHEREFAPASDLDLKETIAEAGARLAEGGRALASAPADLDISDTNVAGIGSEEDKGLRKSAAQKEAAWKGCGRAPGVEVWRVEQFEIKPWPKEEHGKFYKGDSYIVLHTHKEDGSTKLLYDLYFWLGQVRT